MQRKNVPYTAKVWVPGAKRFGAAVQAALYNLAQAAGGATDTIVQGTWFGGEDEYVVEPVMVRELYYGDDDWKVEPALYHTAQALLDAGEQSVLIEINGRRVLLSA